MNASDIISEDVAKLGQVATAGYFLALRLRGASPLMTFTTFPQAWTDAYMENGYMMRDPITTWALTVGGTIRWSSRFLPDPFGVFRHAAEHGLTFGASVAHGPLSALTLCSLARADRELTDGEIAEAKRIVLRLHDLTAFPKTLTDEERPLVAALAEGLGPKEIAARLGVSEATARARIRTFCDAFFTSDPTDALRRARDAKLL